MEKLMLRNYLEEPHCIPFWIRRTIHTKDNAPSMHVHDFVELVYIVSGNGKHMFENDSYDIRGGDVLFINPGEAHTYQLSEGESLEIVNCLFVPDLVQHTCLHGLGISDSADFCYMKPFLSTHQHFNHRLQLDGEGASRVLHLLDDMIREYEKHESGYSTMLRIKLLELLVLLSRYFTKKTSLNPRSNGKKLLIQRIIGYLNRNYEKKLSINLLSDLFNLSPRQLNRVFKEETGMTIFEMIHNIRVEKAKQLLSESDEKVITIAGNIGYEDPAFFNRLFQRKVGCPPGKYREIAQKEYRIP
ncbi:AraC family transcriptional regulator [Paenibacillus thermotolerans]|uniref:AraC family transcriptional regulator n=1 Tax=Paenibacillus thermotolerans TaxID=3027807 RepID=UPI0023682A6A|nr:MULTISPECIES: AraC family transcriptional regulator [unclassified Paenibacillus]